MPRPSQWRALARQTLSRVNRTLPADADLKTVRRAYSQAYPFGHRRQWPYKAWLAEVRGFLAVRFPDVERARRARERARGQKSPPMPDTAQMSLFESKEEVIPR